VSQLLYYLIIKPLSLLPFWVLYRISDLAFVVMYHGIGYRKKVVFQNLRNSFPDKSEGEIKQIARKFYRHLTDIIIESVKLFSISEEQAVKRMKVLNPEVMDAYADKNQSVILVGGHYNSWEMLAVGLDSQVKHQTVGLYSKLTNAFFNKVMLSSRSKYGIQMVTTKNAARFFSDESANNTATLFGADQSPTHNKNVIWTTFLNQETAVAFGTERYSKKYNYPVLYGIINKVKRGHYTFEVEVVTDNPQDEDHGFISIEHTKRLEQQIIQEPAYWLWTHKRWKRKRNEDEVVL
jgi:KDO2-lipid IV(A) lauroyltransferase